MHRSWGCLAVICDIQNYNIKVRQVIDREKNNRSLLNFYRRYQVISG